MEAVKQIFYAFGDRTATLDNSHGVHKLGLISFDSSITKMLDLTDKVRMDVAMFGTCGYRHVWDGYRGMLHAGWGNACMYESVSAPVGVVLLGKVSVRV